ncbi:MAG: hypothetical protein CM15mV101_010 [uncultured marine virus]|nr:MAG: hypothetical protein CM15mV101_010 [uncultured marine virus]
MCSSETSEHRLIIYYYLKLGNSKGRVAVVPLVYDSNTIALVCCIGGAKNIGSSCAPLKLSLVTTLLPEATIVQLLILIL